MNSSTDERYNDLVPEITDDVEDPSSSSII